MVAETSGPHRVDGERGRIQANIHPWECGLGKPKARLGIRYYSAVPGMRRYVRVEGYLYHISP